MRAAQDEVELQAQRSAVNNIVRMDTVRWTPLVEYHAQKCPAAQSASLVTTSNQAY
jgi:hypothetical protein